MVKVVFAKDTINRLGLPDMWPREIYSDDVEVSKPFTIMTDEELKNHKDSFGVEFSEWEIDNENARKLEHYHIYRKPEYPDIEEQLDCLYHCIKKNDFSDFEQVIEAVKNKYPKPV